MSKDYYNILGVDKDANKEEIKKAYRKMAVKYHPDKQGGDEEKFKEVSEAYQILSDDSKRSQYDRFGTTDNSNFNGYGGGFGNFNDIFDMFTNFGNFGGDFGSNFGFNYNTSQSHRNIKKGNNLRINIDITLKEVRDGKNTKIKYTRKEKCNSCKGHGGDLSKCSNCNGTGKIKRVINNGIFGKQIIQKTCNHCNGTGQIVHNICNTCKGDGYIDKNITIPVDLPKGMFDGDLYKIIGKGHYPHRGGENGIYGDMVVQINVINNTKLERNGDNLIYHLKLSFTKLLLGTEENIPTLDNEVKIKVKSNSKPNEILRLRNKGLSNQNGRLGDIMVILDLEIPSDLTKKEKELLEELSKCKNFK